MASMKDYIDCVPLKIKHKVVLLRKTRRFLHCNRASVPEKGVVVPSPFEKFDVDCRIDRKQLRKFQVQRRIDLHGYTQDEAFNALSIFLSQCQSDGIKNALVITGGNAMKISILRTSFTRWAKENFSTFIVSYSFAKLKDGGQGAFYVVLRKKIPQNDLSNHGIK